MSAENERDFGNDADMSVHDKEHPTLGPTEGSQDVDSLPRQIVPMAAFNDPNNPIAVSGSVNLALDDHPVTHSDDYGKSYADVYGVDRVEHPMSEGAKELGQFDQSQDGADLQEDRGEWKKADWQKAAKYYGLSTSGNVGTLKERVEEHEAEASMTDEDRFARDAEEAKDYKAGDWQGAISNAQTDEDLAELRKLYDASGASFATVDKAFEDAANNGS